MKLYGPRELEDDVIAGPVRSMAQHAMESGSATSFFFLRYNDPERHVRLRFHGDPNRLLTQLLPAVSDWATGLMREGLCHRFVFDTYDRETERFGGANGIAVAEDMFAADSRAVVALLHLLQRQHVDFEPVTLAVLTVDALLLGLGLDARVRVEWCQSQVLARHETSAEYRRRKRPLRALFAEPDLVGRTPAAPWY